MPTVTNAALANPWKELWNGDLSQTQEIIGADFIAHAAPITGMGESEIRGGEQLNEWVNGIHSILPDLAFAIEVGPITCEDYLVVRWRAKGTYSGGFPGCPETAIGRKINFTGTDTLRIAQGKIVEYWANADSLLFVQQLGLSDVPGTSRGQ